MEQLPFALRSRILIMRSTHSRLRTPCWLWLGRLNRNGYGRVWWSGTEPVTHRVVYEIIIGVIPDDHLLDHLCLRRSCCNPWHLEPVTHAINTHRGRAVLFGTGHNSSEFTEMSFQESVAAV